MVGFDFNSYQVWFITGSQHLYGEDALRKVAANSKAMVTALNAAKCMPLKLVCKDTVTTPEEISKVIMEANASPSCVGIICWMHTFSPAKMWIDGLKKLQKPMLHLHTQFNMELPFESIDMDFMNLNQSAHGDREFGYICSRLNLPRKIVSGHWSDAGVQQEIASWCRVAAAWENASHLKVARIGDNMREVAVTEGNKVDAQIQFGWAVNGYGIGDVVDFISEVSDAEAEKLVKTYYDLYTVKVSSDADKKSVFEAARQEIGMRAFLESVGAHAFTTTFEDLRGMHQLPGLACQRLMAEGYGFGAEGDWKTAALLRTMKVMAAGLGGVSFMEDYTYDLTPGNELAMGAHMLEVCPSVADAKPTLEVHPLGIGGKADPARLVFNVKAGAGMNVSLVEFGSEFRLIVNEVDVVTPSRALPKLPVARMICRPRPDFKTATREWIECGGAHHTAFTTVLDVSYLFDYARMAGIELDLIS